MILVAKSDCNSDDTRSPPAFTRRHDPDNDFATNITQCDALHAPSLSPRGTYDGSVGAC